MHTAVAKYADHLPLERQVRMARRAGLDITSQTLWDQVHALAKALKPAYERQHLCLQSKPVLGADETTWRVMNKGGAKRWQVWGLAAEDAVAYRIEDSRSAATADEVFGDFRGTAITDGYAGYGAVKRRRPGMKLAHCWAHVRRKFVELEELHPGEIGPVLDLIGNLYDVEREARAGPDVIEARRRLREEKSRQIIRRVGNTRAGGGGTLGNARAGGSGSSAPIRRRSSAMSCRVRLTAEAPACRSWDRARPRP